MNVQRTKSRYPLLGSSSILMWCMKCQILSRLPNLQKRNLVKKWFMTGKTSCVRNVLHIGINTKKMHLLQVILSNKNQSLQHSGIVIKVKHQCNASYQSQWNRGIINSKLRMEWTQGQPWRGWHNKKTRNQPRFIIISLLLKELFNYRKIPYKGCFGQYVLC